MKTRISLLATIMLATLVLSLPFTYACIDPAGHYAVEVVLNKPGTVYNLTALREHLEERLVIVDNSTYLFKYSIRYKEPSKEEVLRQLDFMVMLYEAKFSEGAPYIEGLSDPENIEYYLGARLELIVPVDTDICVVETSTRTITLTATTRSEEQRSCLTVYPDDFKQALKDLLDILINKWQVVSGLTGDDVAKVVNATEPGLAGWNSRLVYSESLDTWKPYYELVIGGYINGLLVKGNACSTRMSSDVIEELKKLSPLISLDLYIATQLTTTTTPPGEVTTTTSSQTQVTQPYIATPSTTLQTSTRIPVFSRETASYASPAESETGFNGLAVTISLVAGAVVALVIYLALSKRY